MKNQYRGGRLPKKGGLWLFADLRWDLAGKKGAWDPNAHYGNIYGNILKNTVALLMGQLLFLKRFRM